MMNDNSFIRLNQNQTLKFEVKGFTHRFITSVDKRVVIDYLNLLDTSSPK
jgi:hypothetical protein